MLRARANNDGRNPAWNSYEKLREVIEKKMFSNTEDLLPVISFNAKASADDQREAPELRRAHGGEGLHREAGAPAGGVVSARAQVVVTGLRPDDETTPMLHLIDRRPNGRGKSAVNRERFLRRYKTQIQDAVKKMVGERTHRRHGAGRRSARAEEGHLRAVVRLRPRRRPRIRAAGQPRVRRRRPHPAARRRRRAAAATAARGDGDSEDEFVFSLSREEFMQIFFDDLELPQSRAHRVRPHRAAARASAPATRSPACPPTSRSSAR